MADSPELPSGQPHLTAAEEHKADAILTVIDKQLTDLPSGQQINILHHVIEDLFFWREACIRTETSRETGHTNQSGSQLLKRLSSLLGEYEKHQAGKDASTRA